MQLMKYFGPECALTQIDCQGLVEYQEHRRSHGTRNQTIVREWQALRRAFQMALRRREIKGNGEIAAYLRTELAAWPEIGRYDKKNEKLKGHLRSVAEIRAVCRLASPDLRDRILFNLMTCVRPEELEKIQFNWVKPAPPGGKTPYVLHVRSSAAKTGDDGAGIVGVPELAMEIAQRRYQGDLKARIFGHEDFKKQLIRISQDLGISPRFKFRDLRTTGLTWVKEGLSLEVAQAVARHTDPKTTRQYLREHEVNPDVLAAAATVAEKFGGVLLLSAEDSTEFTRGSRAKVLQSTATVFCGPSGLTPRPRKAKEIEQAGIAQLVEHQLPNQLFHSNPAISSSTELTERDAVTRSYAPALLQSTATVCPHCGGDLPDKTRSDIESEGLQINVTVGGQHVLIDLDDIMLLLRGTWWPDPQKNGRIYIRGRVRHPDGTTITIQLHRFIVDAKPGDRVYLRNGNGLDVRRENLRVAPPRMPRATN